ncbi:UDP-N-acetylmuramoyl-L-alanyl-D-glutamate--2,6-diaminopimelate ligase [Lentibacillus saliphilus]|uniref:UDP-N-acetylmuramoyl-L-alanyl-D-glutamate--2, 6-diaminopimelate ligase n=1 Tax=Lentibacillus saliphilus TaxID=2737028 RepID=UPI001C2FB79A|nr:UDP-N-acetylmuramoyl-L-alanyl-D-glutamate--2,6-diaminopimelate ligase [Lentibacillus saliphilus]
MEFAEMLSVLSYYKVDRTIEDIDIKALEDDSRRVNVGTLFICIKGFMVDGHDFVEEAIHNGAVAILAERPLNVKQVPVVYVEDTSRAAAMLAAKFYRYPTQHLPVIGVTGTNGKTTVTYLLDAIFSQHGLKTAVIGTIQLKIGTQTYPIENTTPNALYLQKMFRKMLDNGVHIVIMEVSSHALDMGRLYGTQFTTAILTNVSQDHLDYHKTMESYIHAKSLLFAQLGNQYDPETPLFAILNTDDAAYETMKKNTAQHVVTYGQYGSSQITAANVELRHDGTTFTLHTTGGSIDIQSQLLGHFNVYNMLAACGAAIARGVPLDTIKQALETISGVDGRFEQVDAGQPFSVIVDYAHTPDSLVNVLKTIHSFVEGRIYVVVGCGGDRDRTKRPLMAHAALNHADWCVFTSDNPRTEDPAAILEDMTAELTETHYTIIMDRKQAIEHAIALASENDVILIAGKGHETYQQIGHKKYTFDDRKVAYDAILNKET